ARRSPASMARRCWSNTRTERRRSSFRRARPSSATRSAARAISRRAGGSPCSLQPRSRTARWRRTASTSDATALCHNRASTKHLRGNGMKNRVSTLLVVLAAAAPAAHAQQSALNETQLLGRQVFAQSCGICHLQPSLGVKTYGPLLNKATAAGNDEVVRAFIANGTDRMPAFKYYLKPAEIDAIVAYVRTVPVPAAPAPSAQK